MSMVIANNLQAVNTQRQFGISARGMSGSMEKLSSGYKINTGKDDPSGLVISEKLRSQINGLGRAVQNTNEATNVMGIAEGALNEMNSILKKMKALAIHSSNTGVTSADQIAADQAEMDSSIQTLDRIAQTTKFSNDNLLNGAKDIDFTAKTSVQGTQNNSLVNSRESSFQQIFKRDDYSVSIGFTGTTKADQLTGLGEVDFTQQAMKAYVEVDTSRDAENTAQVENGKFTQNQAFTLTGNKGSRAFTFKQGDSVSKMVSEIKSAADSTGIDAALVFNSDQRIHMTTSGSPAEGEFSNSTFKIEGIKGSDGKDITFTLEPTEAMQDLMPETGLAFSVGMDAAGIMSLSVNGTEVTSYWDGSAGGLAGALYANGSDMANALAESLTMSSNIDMTVSDVDATYEFTNIVAGDLTTPVTVENIFGDEFEGIVNGQLDVDLSNVAIDLNALYADMTDGQKANFVEDAKAGNLRVEAGLIGNQSNVSLKISLVGDKGSYATQVVADTAAGALPSFVSPIADGVFANATVAVADMATAGIGYQDTAAINRGASKLDVGVKMTSAYAGGEFSNKSAALSGAAAEIVSGGLWNQANTEFEITDLTNTTATNVKLTVGQGTYTPSGTDVLTDKNFNLSVVLNENQMKGKETYSVLADVAGETYVLTDSWDGSAGAIAIDTNTLYQGTGTNAGVAQVLSGLTLSSDSTVDVATVEAAGAFVYTPVVDFVNTEAVTIAEGLYSTTDPTQGKVEIKFDNFDPTALLTTIVNDDATKAKLNEAFASGDFKISSHIENVVDGAGVATGGFVINLTLTDSEGKFIVGLGAITHDLTAGTAFTNGLDDDGQTQSVAGTPSWTTVTATGSTPLEGLSIRITNSLQKDDFGYQGRGALNSDTTMTAADADADPTMTSALSKVDGTVDGFTAASAATQIGGMAIDGSAARENGTVAVFNNVLAKDANGASDGTVEKGVTGIDITTEGADSIQLGMNTDGQGRVYVKFNDDNSYELYKDSSLSKESLVATGVNGQEINEANNSGLSGITLNLTGDELTKVKGVYFSLAGMEGTSTNTDGSMDGVSYTGDVVGSADKTLFDENRTLITGVELGKNTDEDGKIHLRTVYDHDNGTMQVFAYKDSRMRAEDMVAQSETFSTTLEGEAIESMTIVLNEVRNADNTAGTGLGIVLSTDDAKFSGFTKDMSLTSEVSFNNLGARVYAQDYGSDGMVKVTQDKGSVFSYYGSAGQNTSKQMIDAGDKGTTIQLNGQDATLSVNGLQVKTNGLELKLATQDIQASLNFNQGKVGSTTLAQVGYGDGSIFTKIGALNLNSVEAETDGKYEGLSGLLANAGHVTNETIGEFQGGMQLQLGEGAGDQNRTVVAIKSMTSENLGRVTKGGYWDDDAVYTEQTFTMKDVMGGGMASLSQRPTLAMEIIDQAITDVSELRAQIGAVQSNMLQTNANNLGVTIENITKTESGIRDTDMAEEMSEFTKNQVLQNAAMTMMSNANQNAQSALQLLR